jgi:rod shape determining protein RodA
VAVLPLAYNFAMKSYQQKRISAFLDPEIDPRGAGWGIRQSLIAIGSGGWAGKGFRAENTQVEMGFVPGTTAHTDYIFAAVGEQWGFVGGILLLGAFAGLLVACLGVALVAADEVGLLLTVGVSMLLFFHVYQNIGMTIQLMPITGLPLPFISYGGSFVVMVMFGLGLVNSVWIHRKDIG